MSSTDPDAQSARIPHCEPALTALYRAWRHSREVGAEPWEFAVELSELVEKGLDRGDVRRLLRDGLAEHAVQEVVPGTGKRCRFQPVFGLALPAGTCLVLTAAGIEEAERRLGEAAGDQGDGPVHGPVSSVPTLAVEKPTWLGGDIRQLWWGKTLLRKFGQRAPNQELIPAAFDEQGWIERIDDPISGDRFSALTRLHDVIVNLNRGLLVPVIRFHGDGTGKGVKWRRVE